MRTDTVTFEHSNLTVAAGKAIGEDRANYFAANGFTSPLPLDKRYSEHWAEYIAQCTGGSVKIRWNVRGPMAVWTIAITHK